MQTTLILGIGNTLLADEGLGIHLLDYLREHYPDIPGVTYLDGCLLYTSDAADDNRVVEISVVAVSLKKVF